DEFTGYTRPGRSFREGETFIKPVEAGKGDPDTLALTVYFRVFNTTEGVLGDPFATGFKDFQTLFVPGKDPLGKNHSPRLDTSAKYLYIYQAIYDSGAKAPCREISIRIITSPEHITSWGHFISKKEGQLTQGLGFNYPFPDPRDKNKTVILPIS